MATEPAPTGYDPPVNANLLYGAAVAYLLKNGWRRMESGSGWWWKDGMDESMLGGAVQRQLESDGIDTRTILDGEPYRETEDAS